MRERKKLMGSEGGKKRGGGEIAEEQQVMEGKHSSKAQLRRNAEKRGKQLKNNKMLPFSGIWLHRL